MSNPTLWSDEHRQQVRELWDLVAYAADTFGDHVYLRPVEDGLPDLTFAEVRTFVNGLDEYLSGHGVARGDRVAMVLHNSSLATLLLLGVIASRRVLVPLNPKSGQAELDYILEQTKPALVLFDPTVESRMSTSSAGTATAIADERELLGAILAQGATAAGLRTETGDAALAEADAEVVFNPDANGTLKGAVLSHRAILASAFALGHRFGFTSDDSFITVCPLHRVSGQGLTTLTPLWCGSATTAVRSEFGFLRFWQLVERFSPNWTLVVNAFLGQALAGTEGRAGTSLKGVLSGGSKLSPELIDEFEEAFGVPVYQTYGLAETASVTTAESLARPRTARGTAGVPLACSQVRIVTDGVDQPAGQAGEIWISGENLLTEYLNNSELTAQKYTDGWLHTGDLGVLDEQGNLSILGRIDDMLIIGGDNVYPAEIEGLVEHLPGVTAAAVAAVPHKVMGTELVLVCVLADGAATDPVGWREILVPLLSVFKIPRRFIPAADLGLTELPRDAAGKLDRQRIQDLATAWVAEFGN
jgi:acyl-CoA synthetase (AMP-forming)/AMP-acid ligase II